MRLHIIVVSTRPGRLGRSVADWFVPIARTHGEFEIEVIDLAEVNLPLFDEPRHPRLQQYEHEHTKEWSKVVARADAFVFVTPEYNYSTPPSLVNALAFVSREWAYKPVGFVSYGGPSGGMRGVQMTKQTVTALKMMPMQEAVAIPLFQQYIDKETGVFAPGPLQEKAGNTMLTELAKWTRALSPMARS